MSEVLPERVSPQTTRNWLPALRSTAGVDWSKAAPVTLTPFGLSTEPVSLTRVLKMSKLPLRLSCQATRKLGPMADRYGEASVTPVRLEIAIPDASRVVPLGLIRLP